MSSSQDIVSCRAVITQLQKDKQIHQSWVGKHVPAAKDLHATIEVPSGTAFSTRSVHRGHKEDSWVVQVIFMKK
jgi:hypothetical protein